MIVTRRDGALHVARQVEHGRLAGDLAAPWGNDVFERPGPHESVRLAAARHDEGWRAWDARVLFDEVARRPLHFLEIDAGEHIRLYRQGVRKVSLQDVYAGVLVGMHWTGLYRGRWSAPGGAARLGRSEQDRALQDRVVATEQRRWVAAKERAWTEPEPRSAFEQRLWHNYDLLQLWDLLSLYLTVVPVDEVSPDGEPVPWGPQLRSVEHRAQAVTLPPVAAHPAGPPVRPVVRVVAPGRVSVDPFPYAAPVEATVVATVLPDREWSHAEVLARMRRTPETTTTWQLVPPEEAPS